MSYKPPYSFLNTGRKKSRGHALVYVLGILAALLVVSGVYVTITWFNAGGLGSIALFASDTPTPSTTPTLTNTPTVTLTPIPSDTPTIAATATASAPFLYSVQLGDSLSSIAEEFGVEVIIIMQLNGLDNDSATSIFVGEELIIPNPDMGLLDPTPLPSGLSRGDEIEYLVLPGDNLAAIAAKFLSTEDAIIEANDLANPNEIFVGQLLTVPVRLVTATPGPSPTATGGAAEAPASTATATATSAP